MVRKKTRTFATAFMKTEFHDCYIGIWCNGNTTDSGPVIPGSNPGIPTNFSFTSGIWCNGNTTDSGPVIPGSNPGIPTANRASFSNERCFFGICVFLQPKAFSPAKSFLMAKRKWRRLGGKTEIPYNTLSLSTSIVGGLSVRYTYSYLFSASMALIFCLTSSRSLFSLSTLRFISSSRLLPFLLAALRKPRLFS